MARSPRDRALLALQRAVGHAYLDPDERVRMAATVALATGRALKRGHGSLRALYLAAQKALAAEGMGDESAPDPPFEDEAWRLRSAQPGRQFRDFAELEDAIFERCSALVKRGVYRRALALRLTRMLGLEPAHGADDVAAVMRVLEKRAPVDVNSRVTLEPLQLVAVLAKAMRAVGISKARRDEPFAAIKRKLTSK